MSYWLTMIFMFRLMSYRIRTPSGCVSFIDKRSVDRPVGKNVVSYTLEYAPYLIVLSWRTNVLHLICMSLQRLFCLHRLRSYCATRSAPKLNCTGGLRRVCDHIA